MFWESIDIVIWLGYRWLNIKVNIMENFVTIVFNGICLVGMICAIGVSISDYIQKKQATTWKQKSVRSSKLYIWRIFFLLKNPDTSQEI